MQFPFSIVAAGILPQGLAPAAKSQLCKGCTGLNVGAGSWAITTDDPTIAPGNSVLILSPGSGSNLPQGVSFGQSAQVGNQFFPQLYRNDTGAVVDFEIQFMIIRLPADR